MFEKAMPGSGVVSGAAEESLRVPDWRELTARLGAARDLRAAMGGHGSGAGGGFARFCAGSEGRVNDCDSAVNLTGLVHGKDDAATVPGMKQGAPQADREIQ